MPQVGVDTMAAAVNGQTALALEDIVLPATISWWPPAPGWWILTIFCLVLLVALAGLLRRRWYARAYQRQALNELKQYQQQYQQHQDLAALCRDINRLLKRVAIARFGKAAVAHLSGNAWLDFLQHNGPPDFPLETAQQWQVVCYQAESHWPAVADTELLAMARQWIQKNPHHAGNSHSSNSSQNPRKTRGQ